MQNLIEAIKQRISYLKTEEKNAIDTLNEQRPGMLERWGQWEHIREVNTRRAELEYFLQSLQQAQAHKVEPCSGIPERTPEENEGFMASVIHQVFRSRKFILEYRNDDDVKSIAKLLQYFVNVTASLWNEGLIEKLEALESKVNELAFDIKLNVDEFSIVDKWLHEAHQNRESLADNCKILETELKLS